MWCVQGETEGDEITIKYLEDENRKAQGLPPKKTKKKSKKNKKKKTDTEAEL